MASHRPARAPTTHMPPFRNILNRAAPNRSDISSPTVSRLNDDMVVKPPKMPTNKNILIKGGSSAPRLEKKIIEIRRLPMKFTAKVPYGKSWAPM